MKIVCCDQKLNLFNIKYLGLYYPILELVCQHGLQSLELCKISWIGLSCVNVYLPCSAIPGKTYSCDCHILELVCRGVQSLERHQITCFVLSYLEWVCHGLQSMERHQIYWFVLSHFRVGLPWLAIPGKTSNILFCIIPF